MATTAWGASKLSTTKTAVNMHANKLRKLDVNLPKLKLVKQVDVSGPNELIEELK